MNKSLIASSLIIPALLTGCGSSGSSNTVTAPTYKWQIVQLNSVLEASLDAKCVIYADSALNAGEVISATVAEQDYNIHYYNADGSIYKTVEESDINNGLVTIDSAEVPDNGYVTLEEFTKVTGLATGSYMFSVQKSLLSDMVVNVNQQQYGDCYAGADYRETASGSPMLNVNQPISDPAFYQSSYDQNAINGQETSAYIPVNAPYPATRDTLITAFQSYDEATGKKTALSNWGFIASENLYEDINDPAADTSASLNGDALLTEINWSSSDVISLNTDSGIIAMHDNTSYFWQPIYADTPMLSVAYDSEQVSLWSSYFSGAGSQDEWTFTSFNVLTDYQTDITLPELPLLASIDGVAISHICSSDETTGAAAEMCIDTDGSYSSDSVDYQRTHLRLKETVGDISYIAYQTTYSQGNAQPIVLQSELLALEEPTLIRSEFNLMSSDAVSSTDAVQYLMTQNIDLVNVGEYSAKSSDNAAATNFYSDIQGFVATESERTALYHAMLATTTTTVMNSDEQTAD